MMPHIARRLMGSQHQRLQSPPPPRWADY
ncbi:hypothetical protein YA0637_17510 [Pseudomonas syringae]|nr:hypothetical protein [Pseudomonas syringae]MBI6721654.1 hypothetical protein [Pseudomonas syringae]MBI6740456.1 hypothetical protein [Pseudomonas syringae]MBI6748538.1 hypothetical protein [Pseudomonas syringae]MBI6753239.1 hypothetical protein [Pseudomonas syringae]